MTAETNKTSSPPLSSVLPPLIFGTATFNYQYNADPLNLPTTALVHEALSLGVRAFDTSPYYGPAEEILGQALLAPYQETNKPYPRKDYYIVTKVGRIAGSSFNYTAPWVRKSIVRSLRRLHTDYLDVVYCHDVEFVTPAEVLVAVKELRRIRDEEGSIHYIGISGYPVKVLAELAEMILRETGAPVDCVMSYANYSLQNTRLLSEGMDRFKKAGVAVVPSASILGMGLLRRGGVPVGGAGNWHPAPNSLREVVHKASEWCDAQGEKIEVVAIRWALESWIKEGSSLGSKGDPASGLPWKRESIEELGGEKLGVSVIGVSTIAELEETMRVWRSILDGMEGGKEKAIEAGRFLEDHDWSLKRKAEVSRLADGVMKELGEFKDYDWGSPGDDFVRAPVDEDQECI